MIPLGEISENMSEMIFSFSVDTQDRHGPLGLTIRQLFLSQAERVIE